MRLKEDKNTLSKYFEDRESFTNNDVLDFFVQTNTDIKRTTVNWRIYQLVRQGSLKRIGRGIYAGTALMGEGTLVKKRRHA